MKSCIRNSRTPLIVTWLSLVFLYMPLVMVAIASFNSSKYGGQWREFSLVWYQRLFQSTEIWGALVTTLVVAVIATAISTVLGTLAALVLHRSRNRFIGVYSALVHTPLVVPDILLGISMLLLFVMIMQYGNPWLTKLFGVQLELGMTTVVIAHVTFCLSYVAMVVLGRLQEFDNSLLEAAQDLGASGLYTFFHVTLPVIMPGIIAGALFAFTLSIDDFVITFFVKGAGDTTLPIYVQSAMRHGTPAVLNALSVIFLVMTFILVFVTQKLLTKKRKE